MSRLAAMLITAAIALPCVALAAILILRRYVLVQYTTHTLTMWLLLDAAVFAVGLILRESGALPKKPARHRKVRKARSRR